ncbi:MAG: tRNA (adenosine(37)-N6)-threonylcarbamoyltransferase complex ATPase subunit type 1 TsaE [Flavobacteriales bacterium]|nr:tRNA (adenosine(37)-N6)-threonylcarbamoyltransferase complex ATPase subunit type 1 TsaE [Flavobacteriales bacterium]
MMEIRVAGVESLPLAATKILKVLSPGLILVDGQMGAGKTTLISELCKQLGIDDEPSSPTYSIVNEYYSELYGSIYHIDCYRFESDEEAYDIGIEEYLDGSGYCFVEWSEKIKKLLPDNYVRIIVQELKNIRLITINQ